jgi:uncharacterized membrane protein YeaQ/YmgE (transglycosylase-associated protein family)
MKNTQNAALYGIVGGAAGFGITKLCKGSKKTAIMIGIALALVGAYVGNNN